MTDQQIIDELDHACRAPEFGPVDPAAAIGTGTRLRRRRSLRRALSGLTLAAVAAVGVSVWLDTGSTTPSPVFSDPNGRVSTVGAGEPADGYPDLVTSRDGTSVTGFGWPIVGMGAVSDPAGEVAFPKISKADAESICLPLFNQAYPGVPNAAWVHSQGWIDDFPTRAGLTTSYNAEDDGKTFYASCVLPGDYTPDLRPDLTRVPRADQDTAIRDQCGYLAHVDFSGWGVGAADTASDALAAALVSPDGHVARCVLSIQPAKRVVQVSATTLPQRGDDGPVLYSGEATTTLSLVGATGPDVATLEVTTDGVTEQVPVLGQVYATAIDLGEPVLPEDTTVRFLDASGDEVHVARALWENTDQMLVQDLCFTSVETGNNGC